MGIILISTVDLSGTDNDDNRGNFPHKSQGEIAIGDAMAFGSAIMYGIYAVVMKKRIGNEDRVNMPLFFGLVGLINVLFLWPGLIVLHLTGVEEFSLPPTQKIWIIVLVSRHAIIQIYKDMLTCIIGKFSIILCERLLLGICYAFNYTTCGDCWSVNDDTAVADRTDDH